MGSSSKLTDAEIQQRIDRLTAIMNDPNMQPYSATMFEFRRAIRSHKRRLSRRRRKERTNG